MDIKVLESSPTAVRLEINGATTEFVNALRRAILARVKTFAIDSVVFYENSSAMFDEYIAHRIGLIPLVSPEGYPEEEEIIFTLEGEGPATIYSRDLKTTDKSVKVANENIPIIKLGEGQRIKLEGKARQGSGSKSAKFQPGIATYKEIGENRFEFYVESFGQMEAKDILNRALNIISSELKDIKKKLE